MIDEKNLIKDLMSVSISTDTSYGKGMKSAIEVAIDVVNKQPKVDEWITGRNPTKEECGEYGFDTFQTTAVSVYPLTITVAMKFCYETVRGKEVGRWKWNDRLSPWKVIAWKPLSEPYKRVED